MAGAQVGFRIGGFRKPTAPAAPAAAAGPVATQQVPLRTETGSRTETPNFLDPSREGAAYQTAYGGIAGDPQFGQVSEQAMNRYYDLAGERAFGEGNARINALMAQYGYAPGGAGSGAVGTGAELAGRLGKDIALNRAGAELSNEQMGVRARGNLMGQSAASRYAALTRPAGTNVTTSGTVSAHVPADAPNAFAYLQPQHPASATTYPEASPYQQKPQYGDLWGSAIGGGSQPVIGAGEFGVGSSNAFWGATQTPEELQQDPNRRRAPANAFGNWR